MWPVWVLLWKHSLARKRMCWSTFFEYLLPVCVLITTYYTTQKFLETSILDKPVHRTEPFSYEDLLREHERGSILFTPETKFTNRLMHEVGAKLNLSRLDNLPNSEETGYFPFSNDMALSIMIYSKGMTPDDAIVIFEDVKSDITDMWPSRLNYTIRMKNNICRESWSSPGSDAWSYWSLGDGAGWELIFLAGQTAAFCVLTLLADGGALGRLRARCCRAAPPPLRFVNTGVEAQAEAVYVAKAIKMRECFGLLGVNGAGKSTTFSMLTGAASPTGGDIFANGHRVGDGVSYMRTFSYCPQFGGVDGFLTGRQNLALLLTMRGLLAAAVTSVAAYWIEEVDLTKSADKRVSSYSGGMARRLAAAAALCQAAPAAVLDEPTAGVDPVARRHMHTALMRARRDRSIIVASHSMDEMEALCHRIAIMSGGELRALGSVAALKAQFGKGYSIVFKLTTDQDANAAAMLGELKSQVSTRFECELRDEHRGMLSYHVKESLRYSELFSQLEHLREQFPALVEDYTVTETTLEEVFLILAKEAHATPPALPAPAV